MGSPTDKRLLSEASTRPADPGRSVSLRAIVWFGFVAAGLELATAQLQRAVVPHRPTSLLRTNRHALWMTPVADVLVFAALALAIAVFARIVPRTARRLGTYLPITMAFASGFLAVEGLHPLSAVALSVGLASVIGRWVGRRRVGFDRLVRWSLPALVLGLALFSGLSYVRIASAERRALALCPKREPGLPNVLLIVLDDVRAASLSLYGHDRPTTPNLERWGRRGIVFSEARSPAPWTLPSHASMFTGRWPHELSTGPDVPLDGTFPTLAEVLARKGYATAGFVGNTRYCNALYGLDRGFARYEDDYENQTVSLFETLWSSRLGRRVIGALGYPTDVAGGATSVRKTAEMLNRDVLGWLDGRGAEGRPYFVFVNYYDAHSPFLPPDGPAERFGLGALPLAERLDIDRRYLELRSGTPPPGDQSPEQVKNQAIDLYRDSYESCIAHLDHQVGRLLDTLEQRGALDDTLVIVTSDHGEHFARHGLHGHGLSLYRREVHVPLVIIPPSRRPGARRLRVDEPVSLRDVPATVAEWAELGARNPFPGRSLTRFAGAESDRAGDLAPVLCEVQQIEAFGRSPQIPSSLGPIRAVVSWNRVYIRGHDGREELFDLTADPHEESNLASAPGSKLVVERFRAELARIDRSAAGPNSEP